MVIPILEIFESKQEISASAILTDEFVITAAHTFYPDGKIRHKASYCILVNGEKFFLTEPIFEDYIPAGEDEKENHTYHDLTIFRKPTGVLASPMYTLSKILPDVNKAIQLIGFPIGVDGIAVIDAFVRNNFEAPSKFSNGIDAWRYYHNCIELSEFGGDGISGGGVVFDSTVYGMMVRGSDCHKGVAIKSSYILEIIGNLASD
jgi:hypothetical protein